MDDSRTTGLLLLIVLLVSSRAAFADLFGVSAASKEMHSALAELNTTANDLPEKLQSAIGVSIKALGAEIDQTINKLDDETIPILNDAIVTDIDHASDLVRALAHHLDEIGRQDVGTLDAETEARLTRLSTMLADVRNKLDAKIKDWVERTRKSAVQIEATAEGILVRTTERWILNAVRGASVLLFLIGLLMLGLRLVARVPSPKITRHGAAEFTVGLVMVGCFLLVGLSLAIRPQLLARTAAETTVLPRETPCLRLERQMAHLDEAKAVASPALIASTERRVSASHAECFGKKSAS